MLLWEEIMMARRKSAAKREDEFIDTIFKLSSVGVFIIVFLLTNSLKTSLAFAVTGFIVSLVVLFMRKRNYDVKVSKSRIYDIDTMTGTQFEYFLNLAYSRQGYKVQGTKVTGDYGADLVLTKGEKKIVVQAKRYSKRVGLKAIQEVVSSIAYYKATEGWAVTNNEFTAAAIELARSNGIRLVERDELIEMISQLNENQTAQAVQQTMSNAIVDLCKQCGSELVMRKSSRGQFFGCSSFPKCRYTKKIG
jgi:restriction system protein